MQERHKLHRLLRHAPLPGKTECENRTPTGPPPVKAAESSVLPQAGQKCDPNTENCPVPQPDVAPPARRRLSAFNQVCRKLGMAVDGERLWVAKIMRF